MLAFKPKELMGKKVCRPDGAVVGTIKGVSQNTNTGTCDEVRIENGEEVIFARAKDLVPTGTSYMCRGLVYS
jgi:sporulation protein YlmC with PRC-barrel domain